MVASHGSLRFRRRRLGNACSAGFLAVARLDQLLDSILAPAAPFRRTLAALFVPSGEAGFDQGELLIQLIQQLAAAHDVGADDVVGTLIEPAIRPTRSTASRVEPPGQLSQTLLARRAPGIGLRSPQLLNFPAGLLDAGDLRLLRSA